MAKIALFYNCWSNPTGAYTFTEHLYKMFYELGNEVNIYVLKRNHADSKRSHQFGGIPCTHVTLDEGLQIASEQQSIMTHFMRGGEEEEYCTELIRQTSMPFVIHDPRGLVKGILNAAYEGDAKLIFIRQAMLELFSKQFPNQTNCLFLRHPYIRAKQEIPYDTEHNAVAVSRIAREKNTQIICEANDLLPEEKEIAIFGAISDRIYSYFDLDQKFPNWRRNYYREQQRNSVDTYSLSKHSKFVVDVSTFKGEGGGTQYTFLEAMDAGACLVLHKEWTMYPGDMKQGYNCWTVDSATSLVDMVTQEPVVLPGYEETLAQHSIQAVSEEWSEILS